MEIITARGKKASEGGCREGRRWNGACSCGGTSYWSYSSRNGCPHPDALRSVLNCQSWMGSSPTWRYRHIRRWERYVVIFFWRNITMWSLRIVGVDWMVHGSWVGDPFLVSFILFSSVFRSALRPPWAHQLAGMGLGFSPSVTRSLSLSSFFSLFFPWRWCAPTRFWLEGVFV